MQDLVPHNAQQLDTFHGYSREQIRAKIYEIEQAIMALPNAIDGKELPLRHSFADGMYVREIFIPAGYVLTGAIHRHSHPVFLLSGEILVVSETDGWNHLVAPQSLISKPGAKRAAYAVTDTWWVTVHYVVDERDIAIIEEQILAKDYDTLQIYDVSPIKELA
jgi:hypothetical protein